MSKFIEVDSYIKYCDEHWISLNVDAVNAQPTADVVDKKECSKCVLHPFKQLREQLEINMVEVVRCKDCKWQDKGENECESWNMCRLNVIEHFAIYDEHFCEWGERREDG